MTGPTFIIVGASVAGTAAAAALRTEGFDGHVVVIGGEDHLPYDRPPLSKEYLRGQVARENILLRPEEFYADAGIELRLGCRVVGTDAQRRRLRLADGTELPYDKVLFATGVRNRRLAVPGADLPGVHDLRSVADADRLRAEMAPGRRAVVVGMGFIGSEVAASLRRSGLDVVVIELEPVPLRRVLGDEVGRAIEAIHRDEGVTMLLGESVAGFEGAGRLEAVRTESGRRLECDLALVAVGVEPAVEATTGSGALLHKGILVDEYCRTTTDDLFAAGDVANHFHPLAGRHVRVEHRQNAAQQGTVAARNMLGKDQIYEAVPWFWSDQYEHNLQYAGFRAEWDDLVVRGSVEERRFIAFYMGQGRLLSAVALNKGGDLRRCLPLIADRASVDAASLRDEALDLRKLRPVVEAPS